MVISWDGYRGIGRSGSKAGRNSSIAMRCRGYCGLIAGAKFEPIEKAGHFPHIEQPQEFARRVLAFADTAAAPVARAKRA